MVSSCCLLPRLSAHQLSTRGLVAHVHGVRPAANADSRYPSAYSAQTDCDQRVIDKARGTEAPVEAMWCSEDAGPPAVAAPSVQFSTRTTPRVVAPGLATL